MDRLSPGRAAPGELALGAFFAFAMIVLMDAAAFLV